MKALRTTLVILGGPLVLFFLVVSGWFGFFRRLKRGTLPSPFALVTVAVTTVYLSVMRPWLLSWGSLEGELDLPLPGDAVLETAGTRIQHAVGIEAPAEAVWPWVAQVGQDRGGFYSYEWLENLAALEIKNADRIHPEWQERSAGDTVTLAPETGLTVTVFEPGQVLGIEHWGNIVVLPDGPDRCRLIARGRIPKGAVSILYAALIEIPHFIMERKMLLEIKRLAERSSETA